MFVVVVEGNSDMVAVTSIVVNTLLILCLHFSKQTAHCAGGGAVVDEFLVIGGSATIHSVLKSNSTQVFL